jgi:hypothetical protein
MPGADAQEPQTNCRSVKSEKFMNCQQNGLGKEKTCHQTMNRPENSRRLVTATNSEIACDAQLFLDGFTLQAPMDVR